MAVKKTVPRAGGAGKAGSGFFCYIGPTIRGVLEYGHVYYGTREDAENGAKRAIEREPLVRQLIVPGETLAEDRIKVKTPGTALYQAYRRALRGR